MQKIGDSPSTWFPGFEHGIGMMGDEWRIGLNDGPFPYWTNPEHVYRKANSSSAPCSTPALRRTWGFDTRTLSCSLVRGCEPLSKYPLGIEVIS